MDLFLDSDSAPWKEKVRANALKSFDRFLDWTTSSNLKTYPKATPFLEKAISIGLPELATFSNAHGFFSSKKPIAEKVSNDPRDLEIVLSLLKKIGPKIPSRLMPIVVGEIMTKVLAYRDLSEGQIIPIPVLKMGSSSLEPFTVNQLFDLNKGMPAFGLQPSDTNTPAILLFRGTDLSLDSQRGWASIMSDLDIRGPGLSTFRRSQEKIREWLLMMKEKNHFTNVLGFSLGGALATYTFVYENELISPQGSMCFNAPGVSPQVIRDWKRLPQQRQFAFKSYVTEGDIVSKVGNLLGDVEIFIPNYSLKPLEAHTILISSLPSVTISQMEKVLR